MPVALISSLYRFEPHLPTYSAAVFGFAKQVSAAGVSVHYLPIVNDASALERSGIDRLARELNAGYHGRMKPHYVPRETLYASWNRGLALSQAPIFSFWNADDLRSAEAFIEGYRQLQEGTDLVDFPFTRVTQVRRFGLFPRETRAWTETRFQPGRFTSKDGGGPFFMARRALYEAVGPFDESFQVAGDTEWAWRAKAQARFVAGASSGGEFLVHGGNLSNRGSQREDIELNIIFMRRGDWSQLRPAEPRAMLDAWTTWGNVAGITAPAEVADYLWGPEAHSRWQRYRRERQRSPLMRRLRMALAARGLLHSEELSQSRRRRDHVEARE